MSSAALLVMDVQEAIVQRFGDLQGYLERLDLAISAARDARIPVVYVVVGFRPGHPEVSQRNKTFAALASDHAFTGADPAARIHPAIAPGPADLDYRLVVLADCCLDADQEVHRVLTGKVFPRQADVMTVEQWTSSLP